MAVVAILILAFLIILLRSKKNAPYGRQVVGAILGIDVFFIWPLILFYGELKNWTDLELQIAALCSGLTAGIIIYILLSIKHELLVAGISIVAFVISMFVHFTLGPKIKNIIAFNSDYFVELPANSLANTDQQGTYTFHHPIGGYQLAIPKRWQQKKDKSEWFPYFQINNKNEIGAELRPLCFNKDDAVLTDFVPHSQSESEGKPQQAETKCFRDKRRNHFCKTSLFSRSGKIEKIRWIGIYDSLPKGVMLDFIVDSSDTQLVEDFEFITGSIKYSSKSQPSFSCLSLAEWL